MCSVLQNSSGGYALQELGKPHYHVPQVRVSSENKHAKKRERKKAIERKRKRKIERNKRSRDITRQKDRKNIDKERKIEKERTP